MPPVDRIPAWIEERDIGRLMTRRGMRQKLTRAVGIVVTLACSVGAGAGATHAATRGGAGTHAKPHKASHAQQRVATGKVRRTTTVGNQPLAVTVDEKTKKAFVLSSDSVSTIDLTTGKTLGHVAGGFNSDPYGANSTAIAVDVT